MTVSRQGPGRANQRRRTRAAIVQAALEITRAGTVPTVAQAAEAALVSRATAYRYFPTQESLVIEITAVTPDMRPIEAAVEQLTDDNPARRLERLVDAANRTFFHEEAHQRTALRLYLDQWSQRRREGDQHPVVRAGRRLSWLDRALGSSRLELAVGEWEQLRAALALTLGVEALVVMKDVCQLDDESAQDVLRRAALSMLRGWDEPDRTSRVQGRERTGRAGGSHRTTTSGPERGPGRPKRPGSGDQPPEPGTGLRSTEPFGDIVYQAPMSSPCPVTSPGAASST